MKFLFALAFLAFASASVVPSQLKIVDFNDVASEIEFPTGIVAEDLPPAEITVGTVEITPVKIVESLAADATKVLPAAEITVDAVKTAPIKIVESLESEVAAETVAKVVIVEEVENVVTKTIEEADMKPRPESAMLPAMDLPNVADMPQPHEVPAPINIRRPEQPFARIAWRR